MKTIIMLDKNDVKEIIAKHFEVDKNKVNVCPYITTVGYGMGEHEVADLKVEITKS